MTRNHGKPAAIAGMALAVALALAGGNRKTLYNHYEHTPIAGWEKNDTLIFDVNPARQEGVYREEVGLRINGAYPFQGLCLIVEQLILPSGVTRSDTLNCSLIDREGNVKGQGVSYYQYNFHLTNLSLSQGDSLHVRIRHNMKREILPGIADVGLSLKKTN